MLNRIIKKLSMVFKNIHNIVSKKATVADFILSPPLPLPCGICEQELFDFVTSVRVTDAPENKCLRMRVCQTSYL